MQPYLTPRKNILDGKHRFFMPMCPPPPSPSREESTFGNKTSSKFEMINDNNDTTDEVLPGFFLLPPSHCFDSLTNKSTMATTSVMPPSKFTFNKLRRSQGQRHATIKTSYKLMPRPVFHLDNNFGDDLLTLSMTTPRAISLKPRASQASRDAGPKTKMVISSMPCPSTAATMAVEAPIMKSMESDKRRRISDDVAHDANQDKIDDRSDRDAIITVPKV